VKPGKVESYLSYLILLVLSVIAAGVYCRQSHFDAGVFTVPLSKDVSPAETPGSAGSTLELQNYLPAGMKVLTPAEFFGPETLSEKINGKAELYLSTGFVSLRCQRFSDAANPNLWLEVFVYQMDSKRSAFSVFSTQRRMDARDVDFTRYAYLTTTALFFLQGRYYVEVIAASEQMTESMLAIGQNFVREHPDTTDAVVEVALFPGPSLVSGSVTLLTENVFGFSNLNNTFIAHYTLAGSQLTAFLSHRRTAQEARDLAGAYHQFLAENGGVDMAMSAAIPDAWLVKIFDTFELVFVHGDFLAGVHEAEDKDLAEQLALDLKNALAGAE
jgi:hypothetical protein